MLAGPRPTDRSRDRLTVSRFSSQAENQTNLNVFPCTTEVVDPALIRLLSSSLPNLGVTPIGGAAPISPIRRLSPHHHSQDLTRSPAASSRGAWPLYARSWSFGGPRYPLT